jgi:putative IMPACT (imprinted ancient) family translation regulator
MPQTLRAPVSSELIIKKSRFIGCVQPMTDRSSAQAVVDALWREHPGAAHVCWALLAGGQSAAVDDGEPSGTAGRPMLDVLRHQDLEGVLATVVRYFGGVKLGAGGLVRLHRRRGTGLAAGRKSRHSAHADLAVHGPYPLEGLVRRMADTAGAACWRSITALWCASRCRCEADAAQFVSALNESGQGRIGNSSPTSCRTQKNPPERVSSAALSAIAFLAWPGGQPWG